MTELTPEKLRDAAEVVDAYFQSVCGLAGQSSLSVSLRLKADGIEAKNAKKAERDKVISELSENIRDRFDGWMYAPTADRIAESLYEAGWRKAE